LSRKKIGIFTATGCRTCENVVLGIHYQIQNLQRMADIVFWPYVLGSQLADLDGFDKLDICLFAGAIRTVTDRTTAEKLRAKSDMVVALGACAAFGGMPGLANLAAASSESPRTIAENNGPQTETRYGTLEPQVVALPQIVAVDYVVPGCPPTPSLVWAAIQALLGEEAKRAHLSFAMSRLPKKIAQSIAAGVLPPRGTVFGGEKAVCASCPRVKEEKRFKEVIRPYQAYESNGRCLLEQGLVCQGITTREGCGGLCTAVGIPCRGCFGKTEATYDPGAKMVSAIASTFETDEPQEIEEIALQFHDMLGTFYRYNMPTECALMRRHSRC
jgi:F420-non-reducing hydrogenase small subunit